MNRSAAITRFQPVTSTQLLRCFSVDQCANTYIDTLSVYNGKVLISKSSCSKLFIYSEKGNYISTVVPPSGDRMIDAIWTPRGNIAYTTFENKRVVVITEAGKVVKKTHMIFPMWLSASDDGIIYLADSIKGVYQSTDDGVSWRLVFNVTGAYPKQAVKVITELNYEFWTTVWYQDYLYLRVYSISKKWRDTIVTWKNISLPIINGKLFDLENSSIAYDGNSNIFLSDRFNKIVHLYSFNGQYSHQLLSSNQMQSAPTKLAVDRIGRLYVGQEQDLVCVFNILFDNYKTN